MKTLIKTSLLALMVLGLVIFMAGVAMAAPIEKVAVDFDNGALIDEVQQVDPAILDDAESAVIDDGGEDTPGDDTPLDDGGDDTPGDDTPLDDGGDDTPGDDTPLDDGGDTENTPASSGKLPNTGTQLAIIAVIATAVVTGAYFCRRAVSKRTQ